MPSLQQRLEGGIWGLLVGDALGVPYEFHPPHAIPPFEDIEMTPPVDFQRAHIGVPVGTWSDDGAQALALLASLLKHKRLDINDFGRRLMRWYERGEMAVGEKVFDVGIQTAESIRAMLSGTPPLLAGGKDVYSNGNGSLMRVLPLALWHRGSDEELVRDAHSQSRVTHAHVRSQVCCALYCLWTRRVLHEVSDPWNDAVVALRTIYGEDSAEFAELEWQVRPDDPLEGRGSGYVVDCLRSARMVMEHDTYERVVKAAIALGNDTDTTACVAGGIAGVRNGIGAIPQRWLDAMRGSEIVEPIVKELLKHWG